MTETPLHYLIFPSVFWLLPLKQ